MTIPSCGSITTLLLNALLPTALAGRPPVVADTAAPRDDISEAAWTWRTQAEPPPKDAVRLVIVGDIGTGKRPTPDEPPASPILDAARQQCSVAPCDGVVLLGDNRYPSGIGNERDKAWLTDWAAAWTDGEPRIAPLYLVLGNHDWTPLVPQRVVARRELAWARGTADVKGDSHFWTVDLGPVRLVAWDTNPMIRSRQWDRDLHDPTTPVRQMLDALSADAGEDWVVGLSHHPVRSVGRHGDAGSYRDLGMRMWPGKGLRDAFHDALMTGPYRLWLAGHDHNLQLWPDERSASAVLGSGAKLSRLNATGDLWWEEHGFAILDATADALRLTVFDASGTRLGGMHTDHDGVWAYR